MNCKVNVLEFARDDYRAIRKRVKLQFGAKVWAGVDADFKKMLNDIGQMPWSGSIPEEIKAIGLGDYRQRLVGQTRVIYQLKDGQVYVHLFVDTCRDFSSMLQQRLLG